jgi:hypothetical protein
MVAALHLPDVRWAWLPFDLHAGLCAMRFSEFEYYSPIHDANVARVSVADNNGREFWMIVERDEKGYRERRHEAIDACAEAIEAGCAPGEVRIR